MNEFPPPGWYDDPEGEGSRWWDGFDWTEHRQGSETTEPTQPRQAPTATARGRLDPGGLALAGVGGVLALVGMIALAGCGGSSSSTATSTSVKTVTAGGSQGAPTKAQFIKEADAICANYRPEAQRLQREIQNIGQPQNVGQLHRVADLYRQLADGTARQAEKLRKLTAPAGDESIINNWLSTGETTLSLARDLADAIDAAKGTNGSRIRSLAKQISAYSSKARGIAQGYGFKVCGQG